MPHLTEVEKFYRGLFWLLVTGFICLTLATVGFKLGKDLIGFVKTEIGEVIHGEP